MTFFLMMFTLLSAATAAMGIYTLVAGGGVGTAVVLFCLSAALFLLCAIWWKVGDIYDLLKKSLAPPPSPSHPSPAPPKE